MKKFLTVFKIIVGLALGIFAVYAVKKGKEQKDLFSAPPSDNSPDEKL